VGWRACGYRLDQGGDAMTLLDPFLTEPTPDSDALTQIADLLRRFPALDGWDRRLVFNAWEAAYDNAHPVHPRRVDTWKLAMTAPVIESGQYAPLQLWEAVEIAAKPARPARYPTDWQIVAGLEWAAQRQD